MTPAAVPTLLTTADMARLLGITPLAVLRRRYRGTLPAPVRLGGRTLRWDADDVRAWIQAGKERPKTSPDDKNSPA